MSLPEMANKAPAIAHRAAKVMAANPLSKPALAKLLTEFNDAGVDVQALSLAANSEVAALLESHLELAALMEGYGHKPYFVEGEDPADVHQQLAATLDAVVAEIAATVR